MRSVLASDLLTQRHHYDLPEVDTVLAKMSEQVAPQAFAPSKEKRSLDFAELVSASSATQHWGPTAQGLTAPAGDLQVLRDTRGKLHEAARRGDVAPACRCWGAG